MKPAQRVPLMVARGLAAPWPGFPHSAFASTSATMIRATIQKKAPLPGIGGGRWLAEHIKNSMAMARTTLVRQPAPAPPRGGPRRTGGPPSRRADGVLDHD